MSFTTLEEDVLKELAAELLAQRKAREAAIKAAQDALFEQYLGQIVTGRGTPEPTVLRTYASKTKLTRIITSIIVTPDGEEVEEQREVPVNVIVAPPPKPVEPLTVSADPVFSFEKYVLDDMPSREDLIRDHRVGLVRLVQDAHKSYRGFVKQDNFKSLTELHTMLRCLDKGIKYQYEPAGHTVRYWNVKEQREANYHPDFLIELPDGRTCLVEVKNPKEVNDPVVRAKEEALRKHANDHGFSYEMWVARSYGTNEQLPESDKVDGSEWAALKKKYLDASRQYAQDVQTVVGEPEEVAGEQLPDSVSKPALAKRIFGWFRQ